MKNSAVIELQVLCQDEGKSVTQLLRHALVIATKLDIQDFAEWCNNELKGYFGYKEKENIPKYRIFVGDLYALELGTNNRIPVRFDEDILHNLKIKILPESITEINDWIARDNKEYVMLNLDKNLEKICLDLFKATVVQDYENMSIRNSVLPQKFLPTY